MTRTFRSMIFAGLASLACAIAFTSAAAVPIDPGINAAPSVLGDLQSPGLADMDQAALTCATPDARMTASLPNSDPSRTRTVVDVDQPSTAIGFIDLRRRC
ncbi:hypothetical protein [Sinorhizobium meliloti]|uniref:hypothetical protein n=1 Tax=Rhizobium meliloti TaxID=382 RepID=UPI000FD99803|nr:hypothetical protein [Sinorhizobium meliloti]RVQ02015.1 hypothetical protein CN069_14860 [Sinorhizobium meliloti]